MLILTRLEAVGLVKACGIKTDRGAGFSTHLSYISISETKLGITRFQVDIVKLLPEISSIRSLLRTQVFEIGS
jgi:hypothetical protein